VQVDLDHDVAVPHLPEGFHLPGAVRDREALDPAGVLGRDGVRHTDDEGEVGRKFPDPLPDRGAVGAVLVQRPDEFGVDPVLPHPGKDPGGILPNLREPAVFQVCEIRDRSVRAGIMEAEEFVGEHICGLLLRVHDRNPPRALIGKFHETFCGDVLEVAARWLDVTPGGRSPEPLYLVCLPEVVALAFQFIVADPAGSGCRLKRRKHAVDVFPEPGVDIHCDRRRGDPGIVDGRLEVFADDHRNTGPDDRYPAGRKLLLSVAEHPHKRIMPAEDELVVGKRRCQHPHPVLFEETGVLERTA